MTVPLAPTAPHLVLTTQGDVLHDSAGRDRRELWVSAVRTRLQRRGRVTGRHVWASLCAGSTRGLTARVIAQVIVPSLLLCAGCWYCHQLGTQHPSSCDTLHACQQAEEACLGALNAQRVQATQRFKWRRLTLHTRDHRGTSGGGGMPPHPPSLTRSPTHRPAARENPATDRGGRTQLAPGPAQPRPRRVKHEHGVTNAAASGPPKQDPTASRAVWQRTQSTENISEGGWSTGSTGATTITRHQRGRGAAW